MPTVLRLTVLALAGLLCLSAAEARAADDLPPGWLPVNRLDDPTA